MARTLLRRGVTSFLPTAVDDPARRARRVRRERPGLASRLPKDGAGALGFNLEGPFLAEARQGAHDPAHLRAPARSPQRISSRSSVGCG